MNGYEIYNKVLIRLGYKESESQDIINKRLTDGSLEAVNQILLDLKLEPVTALSKDINAAAPILEAVCCGVAMLLTVNIGDSNKNVIFTALYNAKRAAVLSITEHIKDNLPIAEG